jgi:hypothetical protein
MRIPSIMEIGIEHVYSADKQLTAKSIGNGNQSYRKIVSSVGSGIIKIPFDHVNVRIL